MKYYIDLIKKFFSFDVTDKKLLVNLLFTLALRALAGLMIPLASAAIVDAATDQDFPRAFIMTGVFLIIAIAYVSFGHLNYRAYAKNANYIHNTLQRKILNKVVTLDQDYTKAIPHAEIVNTGLQDVSTCQRIPTYLFEIILKAITIIADAVILVFIDPLIGGITLGLTIASIIIFIAHMKKRDHFAELRRAHQDEISSLMSQIIDGHKEVHAFNLENSLHTILNREKREWKRIYLKQRWHNDLGRALTPFLQGVGRVLAYLIAGSLILKGEYNIAVLVLVVGYYENMHDSYDGIVDTLYELSKSKVAINRMYRLLNYYPNKKLKFGIHDNDYIKGEVCFDHVSFTYGRKPLIRDISFNLEPGTLTGIVGKSGSGKSTILRLLLRLYKPTRGKITIDDKNIKDYNKEVYATNVSIVNQKPFVFDLSIRENLNMVDRDIEHQIEACKKAGIHDFIMGLEKGYDTILVQDGANLSAGHKQLLSLARTLLSKSEVLLFDEVTSSLDTDTTKQVIKVLKLLKKDHTVLVVTHKPEVMRAMDELIVLDDGKMVGRGTHQNLLHNKFYQLLQK